ncbi:MAG: metal ABC transporter permease [Planctomycetes bacterium]|nr:metal ABC transporter permease [Planctomycetota bacterium]
MLPAYNTTIVLLGTSLLGACCGILGTFAVLRQRALLGDALAHSTPLGVAVAFLLIAQREVSWLLLGALASGLLGVVTILGLTRFTRLKEDAAMASVMGVFFAAGMALMTNIDHHSPTGNQAGLMSVTVGQTASMLGQDVYWIAAVSLLSLVTLALLFKEFKVVTFDEAFAKIQGWPAGALELLLASLVALAVVMGVFFVGAILITALLVFPAVIARFWTSRLSIMLVIAGLCGAAMGGIGTALSARYSFTPAAPLIVLVGTAGFMVSLLAAPERGALAKLFHARRLSRRLAEQRLLVHLWQSEFNGATAAAWRGGGGASAASTKAASRLASIGLLRPAPLAADGPVWKLTDLGRERAARVARGRELWRLALLHYPELARQAADLDLEAVDRLLPPGVIAELQAELDTPRCATSPPTSPSEASP